MKQTTQAMMPPASIPFFSTGLFTRRSQLFAPFRSLGVNVVSYHDALLGGQDMEITDLMELQRRPGYSRFCSVQLGMTEVINQFYSTRNSAGQVLSFYDSNLYLALFTSSSITHLFSKTNAAQGFPITVNNMTYYTNGVDTFKYDNLLGTTSSWGIAAPTTQPTIGQSNSGFPGFWAPGATFPAGYSTLDNNGNVEKAVIGGTAGNTMPLWPSTFQAKIADGSGLQWQNLGGIGTWLSLVAYPADSVILDSNGYLQQVTAQVGTPGSITPAQTAQAVAYNTGGLTYAVVALNYGTTPLFKAGQQVTLSGFAVAHGFNGQTVKINNLWPPPSLPSPYTHAIQFDWSDPTSPGGWGSDSGLVTAVQSDAIPGGTSDTEPTWNKTIGGTTTDGNVTWTNIGLGTQLITSGYAWRYAFRTRYGQLSTSSPPSDSTGPMFGPMTAQITSWSINGSNVVTFTCALGHQFQVGQKFYVNGLSTGTYINNRVFTATSVGATTILASFTHATASATDAGSATPIFATVSGLGCGNSLCSATASITNVSQVANVVTFTAANNFVAGLSITISGLATATKYNGWQFTIVSADNPSNPLGTPTQFTVIVTPNMPFFNVNYASAADTGTATFNGIEIYRTADGGGVYQYAGAVSDPGAGSSWSFQDYIPDNQLDVESIAPIDTTHLNDPPPGQPGSLVNQGGSILTYWQGRLWMAVGNRVFFDGGPDIINGVPEECWPPANVFSFPGPVTGLKPTSEGMMVFLSDRIDLILGGPQTLSYYPSDWLKNFGVSTPNCIFQDGDAIYFITTSGQSWSVSPNGRDENGNYVADLIQSTFHPTTSYITVHRNGLDSGLFLSDGSTNVLRRGLNTSAWSLIAKPVGGVKAINSIETSAGVYTLCLAKATGGGYILGRDLTTWQDDGSNFSLCQAIIGSITLSEPGAPLMALQHVVGYFDGVGTLNTSNAANPASVPTMEIMPNEISASVGIGFQTLPDTVPEPPTGQTVPSRSLLQLRWPVNMMNSSLVSQMMHHLQIRITFAPENVPNTVKAIAFKTDQD